MIDGFRCDKCETIVEFQQLGVLGSPDEECNAHMDMISLCKPCRNERIEELESKGDSEDKPVLDFLKLAKQERP